MTSSNGPFRYYLAGNPSQPLESSGFPEDVQVCSGSGSTGDTQAEAVEGKGEVKRGGEDGGRNSGAPHREKRAGEGEEFSNVRRGRGVYSSFFCFFIKGFIKWGGFFIKGFFIKGLMKWGGSR